MTPIARHELEQRYSEQRRDGMFTLALGGVSIAALLWYYAHQQILLYGDAVAHINIARRVLDNRSWLSSFFQLGTVWLPLPHILMLPFVWSKTLWMSGIAGSIPTMVAYIVGSLGIFRLVSARAPRVAAFVAAAIYALNPNLLYMQTTAMNEPLYLAFFIWAIVYFDEWLRGLSSGGGGRSSGRARAWKAAASPSQVARRHATTDGSSARSWASSCWEPLCAGGVRLRTQHGDGRCRSRWWSFCC